MIIKLLEVNRKFPIFIGLNNIPSLWCEHKVYAIREEGNKVHPIKTFCKATEKLHRTKAKPEWKEVFEIQISHKELISKIYTEF